MTDRLYYQHQKNPKSTTPSKKIMTWKELEAATTSESRKPSRVGATQKSKSRGNHLKENQTPDIVSPPSKDPAYKAARRRRLSKKSHLLGNRGQNKSLSPRDLVTPRGQTIPSSFNQSSSKKIVKRTSPGSVGKLLMTPSPTSDFKSPKSTSKVTFSHEVKSSRVHSSVPRSGSKASFPIKSYGQKLSINSEKKQSRTTPKQASCSQASKTPEVTSVVIQLPLSLEREKKHFKKPDYSQSANTRRNLDKRSARLLHAQSFAKEIESFRRDAPYLNNGTNHEGENNLYTRGTSKSTGVSVFVRKRPIFHYEQDRGDFDVVSVDSSTRYDSDQVVLHNTQMHADMKQMFVTNKMFRCTAAFDEHCSNDNLYTHVAKPLVTSVAVGGANDCRVATLLMYGQTGSGKTHTMTGIEESMAKDLFREIDCLTTQVQVQFVELSGNVVSDLLDSKKRNVRIVDKDDGSVAMLNAHRELVTSPEELSCLVKMAKSRRATEATDVNGVSSRSHAVCQITTTNAEVPQARGVLTLIDCAGSERRNDSLYHSRERQEESVAINASLYALKECIRARAERKLYVPYRNSNLTRILRETLEDKDSKLCIIATVAPNATDTEHTLETLRTVTNLVGGGESKDGSLCSPKVKPLDKSPKKVVAKSGTENLKSPKEWSHNELVSFMKKKRLLPSSSSVPTHMDGKAMMRMSKLQLRTLVYGEGGAKKADALFAALRAESDRVAKTKFKERVQNKRQ